MALNAFILIFATIRKSVGLKGLIEQCKGIKNYKMSFYTAAGDVMCQPKYRLLTWSTDNQQSQFHATQNVYFIRCTLYYI